MFLIEPLRNGEIFVMNNKRLFFFRTSKRFTLPLTKLSIKLLCSGKCCVKGGVGSLLETYTESDLTIYLKLPSTKPPQKLNNRSVNMA